MLPLLNCESLTDVTKERFSFYVLTRESQRIIVSKLQNLLILRFGSSCLIGDIGSVLYIGTMTLQFPAREYMYRIYRLLEAFPNYSAIPAVGRTGRRVSSFRRYYVNWNRIVRRDEIGFVCASGVALPTSRPTITATV